MKSQKMLLLALWPYLLRYSQARWLDFQGKNTFGWAGTTDGVTDSALAGLLLPDR